MGYHGAHHLGYARSKLMGSYPCFMALDGSHRSNLSFNPDTSRSDCFQRSGGAESAAPNSLLYLACLKIAAALIIFER
jgi:hypothetical protein